MKTKRTLTIATVLVACAALLPLGNFRGERVVQAKSEMPSQSEQAASYQNSSVVSQDFGEIATIVDNGLIITERSSFDLPSTTLRFDPSGSHSYAVSRSQAGLDPDFGPALAFGFPGVPAPLDDDSEEVPFRAGFPFFGTTYTSLFVNTNGEITFTGPDFASILRDKWRQVSGLPRVSGLSNDLDLNGAGSVHSVVKSNPDRLVVTWNGVPSYQTTNSNTFQITLLSSGVITIAFDHVEALFGVIGIAEGGTKGPIHVIDYSTALPATYTAGAIVEGFSQFTAVSDLAVAHEFYKTHEDKYDFLALMTDFNADGTHHAAFVNNDTHGIGQQISDEHSYYGAASSGSAGELESIAFMNNINLFWPNPDMNVNPPVESYQPGSNILLNPEFGRAVTFDGQTMSQIRTMGTLPNDNGEYGRFFSRGGNYSVRLYSPIAILSHEIEHRWGMNLGFKHPTKGFGLDSFDLKGRQLVHYSYFVNTQVAPEQFGDVPRASCMEGNVILDQGTPAQFRGMALSLDPDERVFMTPENQLIDGYSFLDQFLMGLRRANEVGSFFYVDEPKSIFTGQTLDQFDPNNPTNPDVTMRGWNAMGGIAFKGKRVDLTVKNIEDFEARREGSDNPKGKRFWGPKGNLTLRYYSATGRVDPNGDARIVLRAEDRELGDEADLIDLNGKPVDVKTVAFILIVRAGTTSSSAPINLMNSFRQTWEAYVNGPASGGRGKFDTRLNPPVH